jgi:hypothetical protein
MQLEATEMTAKIKGAVGAAAGLAAFISTVAATAVALPSIAAADPLVSRGIGAASCERLAADIKPAEGIGNPVNLALLAWVQGYISAANVSLLEDGGRHVDMNAVGDVKVLTLVQEFCKANPDRKPVAAIDEFIRKSEKVKTTWEQGTVEWDE